MGLSVFNIKKWTKMLLGRSELHVNQGPGKCYSADELKGYYNDLTNKVIAWKEFNDDNIPTTKTSEGGSIVFPVAVFQYGLGAYDLSLLDANREHYDSFINCADWALKNQQEDGSFNNFFFIYPDTPYSAMAQGEAISLLVRAYIQTHDEAYLSSAEKAMVFMRRSTKDGGVTQYSGDDIVLLEFTHKSAVLNGWIFALFGIHDYLLVKPDESVRAFYNKTVSTLVRMLPKFDNGYWSFYDLSGHITSPFYHNLHIAQMKAMFDLTGLAEFDETREKWQRNQNKIWNSTKAFVVKSVQKIME